jgi:hypothetical protein
LYCIATFGPMTLIPLSGWTTPPFDRCEIDPCENARPRRRGVAQIEAPIDPDVHVQLSAELLD